MNELVTLEQVQLGIVTDEVLDIAEDYKTAAERMETLKFQFKQLAEKTGIKKWETDYFVMTYVAETESVRVDTKRLKNEYVYVVNGDSGELEEVNAYDYFKTSSIKSAYVNYKEKK